MKVAKRNFEKVLAENLELLTETNSNISESGRMTKVLKIIYWLRRWSWYKRTYKKSKKTQLVENGTI